MSYNTSPYAPRARREAINLVLKQGLTQAEAARRTGVNRSTIGKWLKKAESLDLAWNANLPTLKSTPKHHPNAIDKAIVEAIITERKMTKRCGKIIHLELLDRGIVTSLSSVNRTLKRNYLTKDVTKWKTPRKRIKRPWAKRSGDLVQVDTIHFRRLDGSRFYVYTMIDIHSRAAYAEYSMTCNAISSFNFIARGQDYLGIDIQMLQTDNGAEFSLTLERKLLELKTPIHMRHSRVRQSNDNAHIERFNRTLQEECLTKQPREDLIPGRLEDYLIFYNQFRRHLGINGNYPIDLLPRC
jgi:transposase InsO family protein